MYQLGEMSYFGEGVSQQKQDAARWYERAADAGYEEGRRRLGRMYIDGDGVAEDYERGATLVLESAENGYAVAQQEIAWMYLYSGNPSKALVWYERAAAQNYVLALIGLSEVYADGLGVEVDMHRSTDLLRRAAAQGDARGHLAYGERLVSGVGVEEDFDEGHDHILQAAQLNHGQAQFLLARFYHGSGDLVRIDHERAYFFYRLAETGVYHNYANMSEISRNQADKLAENELTAEQVARQDERIAEWRSYLSMHNNRI